MHKFLFLGLFLLGCTDSVEDARQCKAQCEALKQPIKDFQPGFGGHCFCGDSLPYKSEAERFCDSCSARCAPLKVMTCKFGNDTWGAGPDVCECQKKGE